MMKYLEQFALFSDRQIIVFACAMMLAVFIVHRGIIELGMMLVAAGIVVATYTMQLYLPFKVIVTLSVIIAVTAIIREKTLPTVITYVLLGAIAGVQVLYFNAYLSQKSLLTFSLLIMMAGLGSMFMRK